MIHVPFKDPKKSAKHLEMRQLVRAGTFYGVFKHVHDGGPHYRNDPQVLLWIDHPGAAFRWLLEAYLERNRRGANTKVAITDLRRLLRDLDETPPEWVKDKKIRRSHRRRLLMRDRAYYSKYWPDLKPSDRVIMPDGKKKYCL